MCLESSLDITYLLNFPTEPNLHKWRKQARAKGIAVPRGEQVVEHWSTQDKFLIVMEAAQLSEVEVAEYCRSKGRLSYADHGMV